MFFTDVLTGGEAICHLLHACFNSVDAAPQVQALHTVGRPLCRSPNHLNKSYFGNGTAKPAWGIIFAMATKQYLTLFGNLNVCLTFHAVIPSAGP